MISLKEMFIAFKMLNIKKQCLNQI